MFSFGHMKAWFRTVALGTLGIAGSNARSQESLSGLKLPPVLSVESESALKDKRSLEPEKRSLESMKSKFQNGDLLFIRSTSSQAKALEEITGSHWTHVGILFRVKSREGKWSRVASNDRSGEWRVFEAGPRVRLHPVDLFVGKKAFGLLRLKEGLSEAKAEELFRVGVTRLGKPYDIYFLLSRDGGLHRDDAEYCSELVWYTFEKALGIVLGYRVKNRNLKLDGPEARILIDKRLKIPGAPVSYEEWIEHLVIPPESQFLSPRLERVP